MKKWEQNITTDTQRHVRNAFQTKQQQATVSHLYCHSHIPINLVRLVLSLLTRRSPQWGRNFGHFFILRFILTYIVRKKKKKKKRKKEKRNLDETVLFYDRHISEQRALFCPVLSKRVQSEPFVCFRSVKTTRPPIHHLVDR